MAEQDKRRQVKPPKPNKGLGKSPFPPKTDMGDQPPSNKNKNLIFILIAMGLGLYLLSVYSNENIQQIKSTEFVQWMADDNLDIHELKIQRTMDAFQVTGKRLLTPEELDQTTQANTFFGEGGQSDKYQTFRTYMLDIDRHLIKEWEASKDIKIEVIHETQHWMESILSFLPILLLSLIHI